MINSTILFLLKTNFTKNLRKMFLMQGFCNEIVCFVTKPILILNDHVTFSVLDRLWYPLYAGQSIELDMQFRGYINLYLDFSAIFNSLSNLDVGKRFLPSSSIFYLVKSWSWLHSTKNFLINVKNKFWKFPAKLVNIHSNEN